MATMGSVSSRIVKRALSIRRRTASPNRLRTNVSHRLSRRPTLPRAIKGLGLRCDVRRARLSTTALEAGARARRATGRVSQRPPASRAWSPPGQFVAARGVAGGTRIRLVWIVVEHVGRLCAVGVPDGLLVAAQALQGEE